MRQESFLWRFVKFWRPAWPCWQPWGSAWRGPQPFLLKSYNINRGQWGLVSIKGTRGKCVIVLMVDQCCLEKVGRMVWFSRGLPTWDLSHVSSCLLGVKVETGSAAARSKDGGAGKQLIRWSCSEGSCYSGFLKLGKCLQLLILVITSSENTCNHQRPWLIDLQIKYMLSLSVLATDLKSTQDIRGVLLAVFPNNDDL